MLHLKVKRGKVTFAAVLFSIIVFSASGAMHVVNTTTKDDSFEGSFTYFLKNASDNDTIVFNIPDSNTITINRTLKITADLYIDGRNEATGNRMILKNTRLFISDCQTRISHLILDGFTGNSTTKYSAIEDSGATTVVWLDSIEIMGKFFYDNDVSVYPAVQNYLGATLNLSNCKIHKWPGGGISNSMGILAINNSTIFDNSDYSSETGGIYNSSGFVTVFNTTIAGNTITRPGYYGGWTGGAGIINFDGIMAIFNCTINDNSASNHLTWSIDYPSAETWGGGILNYKSPSPNYAPTILSMFNSTISANEAYAESEDRRVYAHAYGGGAYFTDHAYITNCTFYDNTIRSAQNYSINGPEVYLAGSPFFINNLFVTDQNEYTTVYNSNWLDGKYNLTNDTTFNNADSSIARWGYTKSELFDGDSITLSSNGGLTETVPLAQNAIAIGKGIKAGYYSYDTTLIMPNFNLKGTIYKSVYHNGTGWISSETNSLIPDEIEVTELSTDQRGKHRKNPPCVGAFEFTPDDSIPVTVGIQQTAKIKSFDGHINKNKLLIRTSSEVTAKIHLIDLCGRVLYSCSMKLVPGINSAAIPLYAKGTTICRVTAPGKPSINKLIVQQK